MFRLPSCLCIWLLLTFAIYIPLIWAIGPSGGSLIAISIALFIGFLIRNLYFVYFELAFGILIWTRMGRPILLWLSVLIWLSIIVATGHLLLGLTMLAANLAFLPPTAFAPLNSREEPAPASPAAVMV